jgi:hypothetical protein
MRQRSKSNYRIMVNPDQDKSELLDSQKGVLYGAAFQTKILEEYIDILETLNSLEKQKMNEQSALLEMESQADQMANSLEIH